MIEVAAGVARHQEEGARLYPDVYICTDLDLFIRQAPNGEFYLLGESSDARAAVPRAVKKCAPLASRDWDIVIEVRRADCRFGIFRSSSVPASLSLAKTYFGEAEGSVTPAIMVTSPKPSIVTFRSDCGQTLHLNFSHDEISQHDLSVPSDSLVACILEQVLDTALRSATHTFLEKVFRFALKGSHGTLVCVIDKKWTSGILPSFLRDGVRVVPCIDLPKAIAACQLKAAGAETVCAPISYYELLKGMLSFDGITVFSNDGRVIAYNVFVHAETPSNKSQDEMQGARKRAYSALVRKLGRPILAAFYQSQDGKTAFKQNE